MCLQVGYMLPASIHDASGDEVEEKEALEYLRQWNVKYMRGEQLRNLFVLLAPGKIAPGGRA